ncbi:unnamed protein product [Clavelina lepadiformis]|uniref:Protein Wnt n=1 Tax=Clavelina lepadiformis TaxID=159417 RepID=A0ABP0G1S5_CLALP
MRTINNFVTMLSCVRFFPMILLSSQLIMTITSYNFAALSSVIALGSSEFCKNIPGLTPQQRSMCQERPDAIVVVSEGAQLAISECRWQFRNNRWNCTSTGNKTLFGTELRIASKEKAFDYAIKSAGILYAIVTACGQGRLSDCGCDMKKGYYRTRRTTPKRRSPNQIEKNNGYITAWRWGGCSVDVTYGLNYSREFVNAREIRQNARSLMNIHNYEVGRMAVVKNLRRVCRCHGVSGSCTMRQCWITLPSFRHVGDVLRRKYEIARNVRAISVGPRGRPQFLILKHEARKKPFVRDLVYLDRSPSFCEKDVGRGILGTHGRQCNATTKSEKNCAFMCCNRGHYTVEYLKTEPCNCKFFWCCTVQCDYCTSNARNYTCN